MHPYWKVLLLLITMMTLSTAYAEDQPASHPSPSNNKIPIEMGNIPDKELEAILPYIGKQTDNETLYVPVMINTLYVIEVIAKALAKESGSFSGAVTTDTITKEMPFKSLISPWGTDITIVNATDDSFAVNVPNVSPGVCAQILSSLKDDPRLSNFKIYNPCSAIQSIPLAIVYKKPKSP